MLGLIIGILLTVYTVAIVNSDEFKEGFKEGFEESYYEDTIFMKKSFATDRLFGIMELLIGGSPPTILSLKGRTPRNPILLTIGIGGKSE